MRDLGLAGLFCGYLLLSYALALCILLFSILTQIPFFFYLRVRKNSIMYQSNVPQKPNVIGKSKATCPYVITFGMKIGNVQNAAKGIAAIIM